MMILKAIQKMTKCMGRVKGKDCLLLIILLLIIFQSVLEQYFSIFSMADELTALIIFSYGICIQIKNEKFSVSKKELWYISMVMLYIGAGSISSIVYRYQNIHTSIFSSFLAIKWFLLFSGIRSLHKYGYFSLLYQLNSRILFLVTMLMTVWEILFLNEIPGIKYGFYGWDLCAKSVFMIGLLICNWENRPVFYFCILSQWLLLSISRKAKGYGAIIISVIILVWVIKRKKKLRYKELFISILPVICVVWNKIYIYYVLGVQQGYARATLFMTSFKILLDYFPIGTGWGTFCSYFAERNYSPVYFLYGISEHPELGIQTKMFLEDAYWPAVIAETGVIGTIAILGLLFVFYIEIQKVYKISIKMYGAGLLVFVYLLITTVEESGFMQPVLMCLSVLLGAVLGTADRTSKYISKI